VLVPAAVGDVEPISKVVEEEESAPFPALFGCEARFLPQKTPVFLVGRSRLSLEKLREMAAAYF
jgi:hypothetical protein